MQAPEEPRASKRAGGVAIPSPEQLGLAPTPTSPVDWNSARGRLQSLKATCFQIDRVSSGVFRFTCWLPAEQTGKSYRIEADGSGEAEAVQLCLERAERWARRAP
jgi:hypothetical protein